MSRLGRSVWTVSGSLSKSQDIDGPLEDRTPKRREIFAQSATSFFSKLGDISVIFALDPDKGSPSKVSTARFDYTSMMRRSPATPGSATRK